MADKTCFFIAPIGERDSPERRRSDQILRHLVRSVIEPMGYDVLRADELHEEGLITHQVIERLIDGDLVVADLTGRNANVYYELAVRHAAQKPVVHLIEHGEALPFDVANVRAISFSLTDPDLLVAAREELEKKVAAIESALSPAPNPIHAALRLQRLRDSDVPETELTGQVLSGMADIRVELQNISQRLGPSGFAPTEQARLSRNPTGRPFLVGERVVHAAFGEGRVLEAVDQANGDLIVVVRFMDGREKSLLASAAPLKHLLDAD